jgi:hypothetical protein
MIDKRMMYAQGQRVAKSLDGSRPGYRGSDMAEVGIDGIQGGEGSNMDAKNTSGADYSGGNQGGGGSGLDGQGNDYSNMTGREIRNAEEKYLTGVGQSQLQNLYDKGVPKINTPFNLPSPFTTALNIAKPIRDFTLEKNIDYFKGLDQTKYPQTLQGYKDYMTNRLAGYTDAAGNTNPNYYIDSQGNYVSIDGEGEGGIMDVITERTIDDTNDNFFSRFLQNQPEDIRKEIEARIQNYYTV